MTDVLAGGLPGSFLAALAERLEGVTVHPAPDASEVLAALERKPWGAVLLDHSLPGAGAEEVLLRLRERPGGPPVFYVAERGIGAEASHRLVETLRVRRLLFHPLDVDEVARQLSVAVGAARVAPAAAPGAGAGGGAGLSIALSALWEKFRDTTFRRVDTVESAALALLEGPLGEEQRRTAEREVHKLAGSVGTFGFAEASRVAREMELLFQGARPLEEAEVLRLSELAVALRRELDRPHPEAQEGGDAAEEGDARPRLLVVSGDAEHAGRVALEAEGRSLAARVAAGVPQARTMLARGIPDVVLLDLPSGAAAEEGLRFLRELRTLAPATPVLVLTGDDSFADRIRVARLGGRAFLQKPVPPTQVVDAVLGVLQRSAVSGQRVLAVDDDPHVLLVLRALLEPAGLQVSTLDDPLDFWEALESVRPDILVLDVDMPHVSGVELCRVVRNEPRWSTLPVLFLTGHVDAETVHRVFQAGADDYVSKPFVGPEVLTRIENRLERIRLHRLLAETDALTGVANRARSEERITHLLRLAVRHRQRFSLAVLDLDDFKKVNDRWGHSTGDEVLRRVGKLLQRSFREEDVVGRWGGEEFVVGMYGTAKEDGVQRLADVMERLRESEFTVGEETFRTAFSAGVAEFPGDGADLPALYRSADQVLYRAKETGKARVLPAGWVPGERERTGLVDVVLVEDDEALAGLLLHTLETRGYSAEWIRDGDAAVQALSGANPPIRGRVVLMDVDLPGRSGLAVLQELARTGVVERSRVIMLTVRAGETEVLRTLEMGAFDHVAKPFSVQVLLQRIRRAMQEG